MGGPPPRPPGEFAPFTFVLFDPSGRVLNPGARPGGAAQATPEERERAKPITVHGTVVAYASPVGTINLSESDRGYRAAVRDALLWGMAAAALLAIGLGLLVGSRLSRSLRLLTRAIEKMQGGALRQHVEVATRDEIGTLADAFNHMSDELARSHDEIRAQADQLREMAERDGLTKLYNRRHFETLTQPLYEQAARYVRPLTVMIGDIDFFKRINDGFSHATGDEVLRQVGKLLAAHTRTSDVVARYGGEEFVIAFPETELDEAYAFCERLRQTIEAHPWRDIHADLKVTMSMGLNADLGQGNVERMLAAADGLLYQAKHAGRNRVVHRPIEAAA
jgi:diguanylate cyclase (GGDEF)-like protein